MSLSVTWIGAIGAPDEYNRSAAVSPAGSGWQLSLLRELRSLVHLKILGHLPFPAFPLGPLHVREEIRAVTGVTLNRCGYLNLSPLRQRVIAKQVQKRLNYSDANPRSFVITYNPTPALVRISRSWQKSGGRWISIIADFDPQTQSDVEQFADGVVSLSAYTHRNSKAINRFHLDGGVDTVAASDILPSSTSGPLIVQFGGAINEYSGVFNLVQAWRNVDLNAELWISGRGEMKKLKKLVGGLERVRVIGLLPDNQFREHCKKATIFVNPRPIDTVESRHNFPSKILQYLGCGRPVVTTWSEGLTEDYRRFCYVCRNDHPLSIAETIKEALRDDPARRAERCSNANKWLKQNRLWSLQATRLIEWITSI